MDKAFKADLVALEQAAHWCVATQLLVKQAMAERDERLRLARSVEVSVTRLLVAAQMTRSGVYEVLRVAPLRQAPGLWVIDHDVALAAVSEAAELLVRRREAYGDALVSRDRLIAQVAARTEGDRLELARAAGVAVSTWHEIVAKAS